MGVGLDRRVRVPREAGWGPGIMSRVSGVSVSHGQKKLV